MTGFFHNHVAYSCFFIDLSHYLLSYFSSSAHYLERESFLMLGFVKYKQHDLFSLRPATRLVHIILTPVTGFLNLKILLFLLFDHPILH